MNAEPLLLAALAVSLVCTACSDRSASEPSPKADPPPAAAPGPGPAPAPAPNHDEPTAAIDWTAVATAALAKADRPGAVIVLPLDGGEPAVAERPGLSEHPAREARSPASVVKPLLAVAALHEGVLRADEVIPCAGAREIDGQTFTCFAEHGPVALADALTTSCNQHAFEVAHRLGLAKIHDHFGRFGLGVGGGLVPGAETPGASAPAVGSGHGALAVTPEQLARAYAALATGSAPAGVEGFDYTAAELEVVRAAMHGAVQDPNGTGRGAAVEGLTILGKTGTTETGEGEGHTGLSYFAGWAPADRPQIVVVVQIEGEGTGGEIAAPVARDVFAALAAGD